MTVTHTDPRVVGESRPSLAGSGPLSSLARAATAPRRETLDSSSQTSGAPDATVAQLDRAPLSKGGDPGSTPGGRSALLDADSERVALAISAWRELRAAAPDVRVSLALESHGGHHFHMLLDEPGLAALRLCEEVSAEPYHICPDELCVSARFRGFSVGAHAMKGEVPTFLAAFPSALSSEAALG